jgi:hypothetical protein
MRRLLELASSFRNAAHLSRRSVAEILVESLRLRFSSKRLGFAEYFEFRLFDQDLTFSEKTQFCGYKIQNVLEELLVDDYSKILSIDKLTMYALFKGLGLPIPELHAVYGRRAPVAFCRSLDTHDQLIEYLNTPGNLPIYLKPAFGSYGRGNVLIEHTVGDVFRLGDCSVVSPDELSSLLPNPSGLGWLLQEPLESHPDIAALCGRKISSVRVHTFLTHEGPTITKVVWKINVGNQDSDNFRDGQSGNMASAVNPTTGVIERVINGIGFSQSFTSQSSPNHSMVSANKFCNFQLPYWNEVRSLALEAALALPGYINPGWDIAICPDGPRILEVNYFGDLDFPQHSHRQGYLDQTFITLMQDSKLAPYLNPRSNQRRKCSNNGRIGDRKCHWPW